VEPNIFVGLRFAPPNLQKIFLEWYSYLRRPVLVLKNENEIGNGYGLGVEKFATPYGQFMGHTGTAYGFVTLMACSPSRDSTIVLLLNNQNANVKALAFQADGIAFKAKGK
jgi:CubicO group peptidase (beta-lactamase class C family)